MELPALTQVQGAFTLRTSEEFDCSPFEEARDKRLIKGKFDCDEGVTNPEDEDGTGSSSRNGSDSDTGAASPLDFKLSLVLGSFSLVASVLQLLL